MTIFLNTYLISPLLKLDSPVSSFPAPETFHSYSVYIFGWYKVSSRMGPPEHFLTPKTAWSHPCNTISQFSYYIHFKPRDEWNKVPTLIIYTLAFVLLDSNIKFYLSFVILNIICFSSWVPEPPNYLTYLNRYIIIWKLYS